jgi:hypothetical protein
MMYRSNWASSKNQDTILAIWLKREAFERYLAVAAHTMFYPEIHATKKDFQKGMRDSKERLQWDPDHSPSGGKVTRRAVQIGLRNVESFINGDDIVQIQDITAKVREQYKYVTAKKTEELLTPRERVYKMSAVEIAKRIVLDERDIITEPIENS